MGGMDQMLMKALKQKKQIKESDPIGLKADYAEQTKGPGEFTEEETGEFLIAEKEEDELDYIDNEKTPERLN